MNKETKFISAQYPELSVSDNDGSITYINDIPGAQPAAPFLSQVTITGDTAYFSGIVAMDPSTSKMIEGDFKDEAQQVFTNIEGLLTGLGLTYADIAKITVYLTDFQNLPEFNEMYLAKIGNSRPAREAVQVAGLPLGASLELSVTVYRQGGFGGND